MSSSLVVYTPPPAVARAFKDRGYTSLQLESYARHLERKKLMNPPPLPEAASSIKIVVLEPPPPAPPKPIRVEPSPDRMTFDELIADTKLGTLRSLDEIIKLVVCGEYRLKVSQMVGHRRTANVVLPRQIGMWLCRELDPALSYPRVGQLFSDRKLPSRDHTTVLHAYRKIEGMALADPEFAVHLAALKARVIVAWEERQRRAAAAKIEAGGLPAMKQEAAQPDHLADRARASAAVATSGSIRGSATR